MTAYVGQADSPSLKRGKSLVDRICEFKPVAPDNTLRTTGLTNASAGAGKEGWNVGAGGGILAEAWLCVARRLWA